MSDAVPKHAIPGVSVILEKFVQVEQRVQALEQNGIPGVADFFATSALSCLANSAVAAAWDEKQIATFAYDVAEAMMEERAKRNVK